MPSELAETGRLRIEWARSHMPVLSRIAATMKETKSLQGLTIAMALHVEAKTAVLALILKDAGAKVRLASCNPLSTDDAVAVALNEVYDIETYAKKGQSNEEYYAALESTLTAQPDLIIDDGADLVGLLHTKYLHFLPGIKGANEETTTGVIRLRAMAKNGALKFPVMAVNDAKMKHLFDNRYGTGQSTFDGIFQATNLLIAGKRFVVAGYGWCGRGVALRAQGLGAQVIVTEIDPVKALEARMDGHLVMPMAAAAEVADFILTVTGCKAVVGQDIIPHLKDGVVLGNAGHFDNEIDKEALEASSTEVRPVRDAVTLYQLQDGRRVYLMAEGRLVNLAAGLGHPAEIMDMSFAVQAISAEWLAKHSSELEPGVIDIPPEIDDQVARYKLEALGVTFDHLTAEQATYLDNWQEGT